ncbi:MAG: PQQ-binding-like beta-propeller repeat protein [Planctomycetota bacterium]
MQCYSKFKPALVLAALTAILPCTPGFGQSAAERAESILKESGFEGGLLVHLGCGDGSVAKAIVAATKNGTLVHGLSRDNAEVLAAREALQQSGDYGPILIDQWNGKRLPYNDNLVNVLVVDGPSASGLSKQEVERVLAPGGVAIIDKDGRWVKVVKPRPADISDWTHFAYDSTGNAVAPDQQVGPPRHLQWVGSPRWSRHHDRMASMSALVSSENRVFYIMDEGSRMSIELPAKWSLITRDAFNGVVLWKLPIPEWHSHMWPLKSGPTQLARRLVTDGGRVYVTLGFRAPVSALDAATGKHLWEGTEPVEEIIHHNGTLYVLANPGESELSSYRPLHNVGDQARVAEEFIWNEQPRKIVALDAATGDRLWEKPTKVAPITLAANAQHVVYFDGQHVQSLDPRTGGERWTSAALGRKKTIPFHFGPKLVLAGDVVLFAGGDRKMAALDARTGKALWSSEHPKSGYQSPEDLLVIGDAVWAAPTTSGKDTGIYTGRYIRTGQVIGEFPPDVDTYWFHHRCYMAKATERFLLPSRTGIEFVDPKTQHWQIHHWVRGGCLYGIMPCNGMVYAPPHDCACYPEAKLFGFSALAPEAPTRKVRPIDDSQRLERGEAYESQISGTETSGPWPTYRGNEARSGSTDESLAGLNPLWEKKLGGKLSSLVAADGKLFLAQRDQCAVWALDAASGEPAWRFTAGAAVDSPPTIYQGRALFGSADGWIYCLRAADGKLMWRFLAAPEDRRTVAYEHVESVWPVHGSVLVSKGELYAVAGRSIFLDDGMWLYRLDPLSGKLISKTHLDDRGPAGEDIQDHLMILNMPVGLPDVLSTDGRQVFMKSQAFDLEGQRQDLGPHSGNPAEQGAVQDGILSHLFAPTGFLDDTWFHRSYWVFGRSFAGGHGGYYQAGRYTPSGRILVHDMDHVFGFARKPQYYRWTTPIEHHLFASPREQVSARTQAGTPSADPAAVKKAGGSAVRFGKAKGLNPQEKALTVAAWVKAETPEGVVLAHGGPQDGYALVIRGGKPEFNLRANKQLTILAGDNAMVGRWAHLAGVLTADKQLQFFVDGKLAASGKAPAMITTEPRQGFDIGLDEGSAVGEYKSPLPLKGSVDEVRIYHRALSEKEIVQLAAGKAPAKDPALVLACSFDDGSASDASRKKHDGDAVGTKPVEGKFGKAIYLAGSAPKAAASSSEKASPFDVRHAWTLDVPLLARAMVLAGDQLVVAGPPDLIDEEKALQGLAVGDEETLRTLAAQDAALEGAQGSLLYVVSSTDGKKIAELKLDGLPTWDGMIVADGKLIMTTTDGRVVCRGK